MPLLDADDRDSLLADKLWLDTYGWLMPPQWRGVWVAHMRDPAHGVSGALRDMADTDEARARFAHAQAANRSANASGGGITPTLGTLESVRGQLSPLLDLPAVKEMATAVVADVEHYAEQGRSPAEVALIRGALGAVAAAGAAFVAALSASSDVRTAIVAAGGAALATLTARGAVEGAVDTHRAA